MLQPVGIEVRADAAGAARAQPAAAQRIVGVALDLPELAVPDVGDRAALPEADVAEGRHRADAGRLAVRRRAGERSGRPPREAAVAPDTVQEPTPERAGPLVIWQEARRRRHRAGHDDACSRRIEVLVKAGTSADRGEARAAESRDSERRRLVTAGRRPAARTAGWRPPRPPRRWSSVTGQPSCFSAATALPITTGTPANSQHVAVVEVVADRHDSLARHAAGAPPIPPASPPSCSRRGSRPRARSPATRTR